MSAEGIPTEWYFITSPQDVSWNKESVTKEVATYGTNNPYINYGTTKLRKLTLGNAMIEGFSDSKQVENNLIELEACMRMIIEEGTGYAAPYCWNVFAGGKSYGTFIIESVSVKEEMRDMAGKATRAFVDVSFQEVSPYQVASGIDITSTATVAGMDPRFQEEMANKAQEQASSQDSKVSASKNQSSSTSSSSSSTSSSSAPPAQGSSPADAAEVPTVGAGTEYALGHAPGQFLGPSK